MSIPGPGLGSHKAPWGPTRVPLVTPRVPQAGPSFPQGLLGQHRGCPWAGGSLQTFWGPSTPLHLGCPTELGAHQSGPHGPCWAGGDLQPCLRKYHPAPPRTCTPGCCCGTGRGAGTHGLLLPRRRPRSMSCGAPRMGGPCRSTCLRTARSSHKCKRGHPPDTHSPNLGGWHSLAGPGTVLGTRREVQPLTPPPSTAGVCGAGTGLAPNLCPLAVTVTPRLGVPPRPRC